MLAFLPDPGTPPPRREPAHWRRWLFASAGVAAFATMLPWVQVRFTRLFGDVPGPPGWQSSAGFTCLCTCLLVAVMALAETHTRTTHEAARPGSLLLVAVSTGAVALEWWQGPGTLRGVSAAWTPAFWLALASLPVLLAACFARWARSVARAA